MQQPWYESGKFQHTLHAVSEREPVCCFSDSFAAFDAFDPRPSMITVVCSRPLGSWMQGQSPGSAHVLPIRSKHTQMFLNSVLLDPSGSMREHAALNRVCQTLSDSICLVCDSFADGARCLRRWTESCEALRWTAGYEAANLPALYIYVRSDSDFEKLARQPYDTEQHFKLHYTRDTSLRCRKSWKKVFSCLKVHICASGEQSLPEELLGLTFQTRSERQSRLHLWSLQSFSELQTALADQFGRNEVEVNFCRILSRTPNLYPVQQELWMPFFKRNMLAIKECLCLWASAMSWAFYKQDHGE